MQFPYYFHLGSLSLHPHPVMEATGYLVGLVSHFLIRKRQHALGTAAAVERNLWHIAGAAIGALIGANLLNVFESSADAAPHPFALPGFAGKTVVGGLVGGWIGIEIAKRFTHTTQRTGDAWMLPLCLAIAIGRVGCFLTGLDDHTYGTASNLPWAVDFGDRIPRHPTQLYESLFLLLLAPTLLLYRRMANPITYRPGTLFRLFMLVYCAFRLVIEFIKPSQKPFWGLSAIQITCAAVCAVCAMQLYRMPRPRVGLVTRG